VLYGPSGAGKSSLLQAGVAPALRARRRTAVVVFDKWSSPSFLDDLKHACLAAMGDAGASLDAGQPLDELLFATSERGRSLLIILNQFEEYLLSNSAAESTEFESQFARSVNREDHG